MKRRTKIVATLGPASDKKEAIEGLITAGVNVFRLNFSHGDADQHRYRARQIRQLATHLKTPIGILCDMQGPKVRIGRFADEQGIVLADNDEFRLDSGTDPAAGDEHSVFIERDYLDDFAVGDRVLLDDGRIVLQIAAKTTSALTCRTVTGGVLSNYKGINKFGGGLSAKALTDKDRRDIKTAADLGCDYLAVSFVRCASDIEESRELLAAAGSRRQQRPHYRQNRTRRGHRRSSLGWYYHRRRRNHGGRRRSRCGDWRRQLGGGTKASDRDLQQRKQSRYYRNPDDGIDDQITYLN